MANASRAVETLEPRRLLTAEVPVDVSEPAPVEPDADLPIVEYTSDVVIAASREQIYPPLAPAMWSEESVGSFEEPEAITVAFFAPDPVDETPVEDEANVVAPSMADAPVAPRVVARLKPIAREVFGADDDAPLD